MVMNLKSLLLNSLCKAKQKKTADSEKHILLYFEIIMPAIHII